MVFILWQFFVAGEKTLLAKNTSGYKSIKSLAMVNQHFEWDKARMKQYEMFWTHWRDRLDFCFAEFN
jgi:hypothetical protein